MSAKKNVVVVILCLIPTAIILFFVDFNNDCLKESEAKLIFEKAVQLEKNGDLKGARIRYKVIDANACTNYKLRGEAFNKAVAIQKVLIKS
jgi:Flp pilus assembly protein TadD